MSYPKRNLWPHWAGLMPVLFVVFLCCCALAANAGAPDPSAFKPFPTYGIGLSPSGFISGTEDYTLTVFSGAYLSFAGYQYPITLTWGFYAVNKTGNSANDFQASGSDIGDWGWDQKPNHGTTLSVGGWSDPPKKEAIVTPASGSVSKAFSYDTLSFTGQPPSLGLHVTVSIPNGAPSPFGGGNTGHIIPIVVPEPGGLIALSYGVIGCICTALRRRRSAKP